jgi:hypothetical protein
MGRQKQKLARSALVMTDHVQRTRQHDVLFGIRRSVRYHARRRRFFDRLRKGIVFLTVVTGVATLVLLLSPVPPVWSMVTAVLVSLFGTIDLILNTAEGARVHGELMRKFMELEMGIVLIGESLSDQQLREFASQRLRIELEEPPIMRVLDCVCHNELVQAMGQGKEYEVRLTVAQRFFANFFDICPGEIRAVPYGNIFSGEPATR